MNRYKEIAQEVRVLVGDNKTEKAIELLLEQQIAHFEKALRILESRYKRLKRDNLSGIIDNNSFSIEFNRINDSLLELAKELETYPVKIQLAEKRRSYKKKFAFAFSVVIFLSLATIWITSHAKEKDRSQAEMACAEKWEDCLKSGEIGMYKKFIESKICNNDSLIKIANDSIDVIIQRKEWHLAKSSNTFQAYADFFSKYPDYNAPLIDIKELKSIVAGSFNAFYRFDGNTNDAFGKKNGQGFYSEITDNYNVDRFDKDKGAYMFNRSKYFDKERIEISSPIINPFTRVYSMSFWVKFTSESDGGVLFGQYQEELWWKNHGRYNHKTTLKPDSIEVDEFLPSGGGLSKKLSKPLNLGQWHHVVIARDLQTVFFYLNGDKIHEWDYDESYRGSEGSGDIKIALIGGTIGQGEYKSSFKGRIDDLGFSETTLNEKEVSFIYNIQKLPEKEE